MTGPDPTVDAAVDPEHHALLGLHGTAGTFGGLHPDPGNEKGFGPGAVGEGLATIADASPDQVSFGARLDLLHALAKSDFPGYEKHQDQYRDLARSVAEPHGLDAETVLNDVKASARGDQAFADTTTGHTLPHEAVAFVGQEICNTAKVMVGGKPATWIFSEFETDAPFETLAGWVDPHGWPKRSPLMFKRMDPVSGVSPLSGLEAEQHWHGVFEEEVQLVDRLKTLLNCTYFASEGTAVGMTYDLNFSINDQILVDRGFLLASHVGDGVYRAKALKIVGFETSSWDTVARFVCPLWTEFVRQAARGGSNTTPLPPTKAPSTPGGADGPGPLLPTDVLDQWVDFFGDAAKTYAHLVTDVANRAVSGKYGIRDATTDTAKYWSQLAKDWATAWSYGLDLVEDLASGDRDATTFVPPPGGDQPEAPSAPQPVAGMQAVTGSQTAGPATDAAAASAAGVESTTVPMPRLVPTATVSCSDLVCIEAGNITIPTTEITVTRTTLAGGVPAVTVGVEGADRSAGLYVGTLSIGGGGTVPVQLYVSGAVEGA